MSSLRVIAGDFRPEKIEFDGIGLNLHNLIGAREYIQLSQVANVALIEREWRSSIGDKLSGLTAGGIVGGIAAGAMAGGLTGPAGAVLGAVAGAVLAGRRFVTCQVLFADGRRCVATASNEVWAAIRNGRNAAERASKALRVKETNSSKSNAITTVIKDRLPFFLRRRVKADDA